MNNIIIDSNIWIYAYDSDSKYFNESKAIIQSTSNNLYITPKQISEFIAVLTKQKEPMLEIIDFLVNNIINNSILLFPNKFSIQKFTELCQKYQPRGNRVYDIEIISIALANNISKIASFNAKDFKEIDEIRLFE